MNSDMEEYLIIITKQPVLSIYIGGMGRVDEKVL